MDRSPELAPLEALGALERFVVENDDLLALESIIGRFNIFDALRIDRAEIRHSNFLAFILDPSESHGQSQLFLKALLMDLLKAAPVSLRPFSPIEMDGTDLRGVTVRREWQNIDLLITCEQPAFVVAIENKIDSREHSNQLQRYQETIKRLLDSQGNTSPDNQMFVFLTPDGSEASEKQWVSYSYGDIHRVLSRVRQTCANAIGNDVLVFLDHYLTLIGTRLMDDAKIDELCQRIYNTHRQALQLIYERAGSPESGILADVEAAMQEDSRWHVFYRTGRFLDFVPRSWMDWMPSVGVDSKEHPKSWIVFRFLTEHDVLFFYAEIRKMSDSSLRSTIVDKLVVDGAQLGFSPKKGKLTGFYTRIHKAERIYDWKNEEGPDEIKIRAATKKKLDELYPKLHGLERFLQNLVADTSWHLGPR